MLIRWKPSALRASPHDCGMPGIRFLPYGLLSLSRRGAGTDCLRSMDPPELPGRDLS